MKLEKLLSSLTKLRKTGKDSWIACCPAHHDKSPSLHVTAKPDTILLKCFAGCSTDEVLSAVGMTYDDLYPSHSRQIEPQRIPLRDAISCIAFESLVVMASAGTMRERNLTSKEMERLVTASSRIQAALDLTGVTP
jgi:hypothetical protein